MIAVFKPTATKSNSTALETKLNVKKTFTLLPMVCIDIIHLLKYTCRTRVLIVKVAKLVAIIMCFLVFCFARRILLERNQIIIMSYKMLNMFKPPTQPESDSLSSDWRIAEVNLSGTRQNKLCRVPLSTNNDARHIPLC